MKERSVQRANWIIALLDSQQTRYNVQCVFVC